MTEREWLELSKQYCKRDELLALRADALSRMDLKVANDYGDKAIKLGFDLLVTTTVMGKADFK